MDRRDVLAVAVLGAVLTVVLGCASSTSRVDMLRDAFPTFERLGVTRVTLDEHHIFMPAKVCVRIESPRGAFERGCLDSLSLLEGHLGQPMDVQAQAEVAAIRTATGGRLRDASIEYDAQGRIARGTFDMGGCSDLVYRPGYRRLPRAEYSSVTRIDDAWYAERTRCSILLFDAAD